MKKAKESKFAIKRLYILTLIHVAIIACQSKPGEQLPRQSIDGSTVSEIVEMDQSSAAKFTFDTTSHDFGEIAVDTIVYHPFIFTNSGRSPMLISSVKSTCGCTIPKWPSNVIEPSKSDTILVSFNSRGRKGKFLKSIDILANTLPAKTTLYIEGFVQSNPK